LIDFGQKNKLLDFLINQDYKKSVKGTKSIALLEYKQALGEHF
jgi:hypothetical protein